MKLAVAAGTNNDDKKKVHVLFYNEKSISEFKYGNKEKLPGSITVSSLEYYNGDSGDILFACGDFQTIICGLGNASKLTAEALRNCGASVVSFAIARKIQDLSVELPAIDGFSEENVLRYIAEGMSLANYRFNKYRAEDKKSEKPVKKLEFITGIKSAQQIIKETEITALNTFTCRDMINDTTDEINPESFAAMAKKISSGTGLSCTVLDKKKIIKKNMGLLLAVNRGSAREPRVVRIDYRGDRSSKKLIGLVGKGITFDSGGMNLKPSGSMETMRCDMSGAATVLCVMKTLAELGIKKNVTAVIPLTENMLSNSAYRPGDVYRSYSGKTVEIGNTDAEGRLILADAISYMEKEIKPDLMVDMATLTGACVVTFGETVAAYLSTDDSLAAAIEKSSLDTGEKLWRLPFFDDYDDRMKSEVADLSNMSSEKNAGTIAGAVFLRSFVEKTPWLHIDIAGTAWYSKARGYRPKNATGYGLRLLVDLVRNWS